MIEQRGERGRGVVAALAALLIFALAGRATAQDEDAVYAAYGAYQAALQSGDAATAAAKAEEAWGLAELVWGDSDDTAVFAFTYASHLFQQRRLTEAGEVADRVVELLRSGYAPDRVSRRDADIIVVAADLEGRRRHVTRRGREGVAKLAIVPPEAASTVTAMAALLTADSALDSDKYEDAAKFARSAEVQFAAVSPDAAELTVEALVIQAAAAFHRGDGAQAAELIEHAILVGGYEPWDGSGPPGTPLQYRVSAWKALIENFRAMREAGYSEVWEADLEERRAVYEQRIASGEIDPPCYEWRSRTQGYPESALRDHRMGAVILNVDVSQRGRPENIRVLASIGGGDLADSAVSDVKKWRASFKPNITDPCRTEQEVLLLFVLEK